MSRKTKQLLLTALSQSSIQAMSKGEKKVVARVMTELGWASRQLERWLGISDSTVIRALSEKTPASLEAFEEEFRATVAAAKQEGLAMVLRRMFELIPKAKNLEILIATAEFFEGNSSKNKGGNAPVQINTTISWVENHAHNNTLRTNVPSVADAQLPNEPSGSVRTSDWQDDSLRERADQTGNQES